MVRGLTGVTNQASCVESTQGTGWKIGSQGEALSFIRMEIGLMGFGLVACHRERGE